MNNDNYIVKDLEWDTKYFGVKSAKIDLLGQISDEEYAEIKRKILKYDFVTIVNHNDLKENNEYILMIKNATLKDVNVRYLKNINDSIMEEENSENIQISNNVQKCERLLALVKSTSNYSRFLNEPNLDPKKASLVYYNWLLNSFNKADKYISVYSEHGQELGFLLFNYNKKERKAILELLVVSPEHTRRGIGRKLMHSLEHYLIIEGVKTIELGTQQANMPARKLYMACGYSPIKYNSIYHVWRKK